jgi:Protein of unknown function (DUF2877)
MLFLPAVSVSRSIRQGLSATPLPLRVLSVFDNAWDLVAADGRVFALVTQDIGDGPLNIVLPAKLPHLLLPPAGAPASIDVERLSLGEIEIGLACADWDPCPDWGGLRARYPAIRAGAPALARLARQLAPSLGLLALLEPAQPTSPPVSRVLDAFRQRLADLPPGQRWPAGQVEMVAARLAGLGWGLTPAGDDWLAGMLAWAWLAHPHPQDVGAAVVAAAAPRTTTLSAAFLRSAAHGECDATWQNLLAALASGRPSNLRDATRAVLAHGETSGADRLAGFLYPLEPSMIDASSHL